MIAFVILHRVPTILLLTLAGLIYLTWVEVRAEPVDWTVKLWWCLLVALFNLPAYIVMRFALAVQRQRR
jgi:hypothetical protein